MIPAGYVDLSYITQAELEHPKPSTGRSLSKQGIAKVMSGQTKAREEELAARARHVQEVDAWLADKTSAFCKIVPCRPVRAA